MCLKLTWNLFTPQYSWNIAKVALKHQLIYKKGCTWLAAASDKVYQLLAHGRWFSLGTPASSTTKTGRHDIAEILLKMALNTKNQISQAMKKIKLDKVVHSMI
jgi:hypothetical protein